MVKQTRPCGGCGEGLSCPKEGRGSGPGGGHRLGKMSVEVTERQWGRVKCKSQAP